MRRSDLPTIGLSFALLVALGCQVEPTTGVDSKWTAKGENWTYGLVSTADRSVLRCGADGDWKSSIIPDEWYPPVTATLAGRWRAAKFYNACRAHDECYDTLGKSRIECDRQFLEDLKAECARAYNTVIAVPAKRSCYLVAQGYYEAVVANGAEPYRRAQEAARAGAATTSGATSQPGPSVSNLHASRSPFAGGPGTIFGITADGRHLRYGYTVPGYEPTETAGRELGTGWNRYVHVFSGGDRTIFGVEADGQLYGNRLTLPDHQAEILAKPIKGDISNCSRLFAGDGNTIFCQHGDELSVYRVNLDDESPELRSVANLGTGWKGLISENKIFAGDAKTVFAIDDQGNLRVYRYGDGPGYGEAYGEVIGTGWNRYKHVFAGDKDTIFGVEPDGDLWVTRHSGTPDSQIIQLGKGWSYLVDGLR